MNVEELRNYCLRKQHVTESFPFDAETLVFKVANKMFALCSLDEHPAKVNLKCEPIRALELRAEYNEIIPGYHMNKKHWNTVTIESSLSDKLIMQLIDNSYSLAIKSLPKKTQTEFGFLP